MTTTSMTWNRLRNLVRNRDRAICYHCKKVASDGHCDHLIPLSRGGTDAISNLVWSCSQCNLSKGNRMIPIKPKEIKPDFTHIWDRFVTLIVKLVIPPYPTFNRHHFPNWDAYDGEILNMRKNKIILRICMLIY